MSWLLSFVGRVLSGAAIAILADIIALSFVNADGVIAAHGVAALSGFVAFALYPKEAHKLLAGENK